LVSGQKNEQEKKLKGRFEMKSRKGDITIEACIGAVLFFMGLYIFLIMFDAIGNDMLFPLIENTEAFTYGATIKLILTLIPVVMAIMGIVVIVKSFTKPPPPQVYYQ
jgi:hypothetical protein